MLGGVTSPFRSAPTRTTCALGITVYGVLLMAFSEQFTSGVYQPARNLLPLPVWGALAVASACFTLFGLYLRPLLWRPTFGAPQMLWMTTWTVLLSAAVISDSFDGGATPGGPVLWGTVTAMFMVSYLHDVN